MRFLAVALFATFYALPKAYGTEQERLLESPRFENRGNTFVAAYDSDEASRGNPASLGETKIRFQLRLLQADILIGTNTVSSLNSVTQLEQSSSAVGILQTFSNDFGKRQYGRLQIAPFAMRFGSFEVMPFAVTSNFVDLRNPGLPEVDFKSDSSAGLSFSYAHALSKEWTLGATLRTYYRSLYEGDVSFSSLLNFLGQSNFQLTDLFTQQTGMQWGLDIGATYQPTAEWRFGFLVENLGYAGSISSGTGQPPPYQQRVDLGLNYRIDWKPWHLDNFIDVQDAFDPQSYNLFRLIHLGTEIGRSYISRDNDIGLAAGVNEGYLTTGAFVDLYAVRLNLSYYAVELGEYPGQREDRRWGATMLTSVTF